MTLYRCFRCWQEMRMVWRVTWGRWECPWCGPEPATSTSANTQTLLAWRNLNAASPAQVEEKRNG